MRRFTIDVAATIPGVTEVEGGTYALMSHNFDYMEDLRYAAKILCTVVSTPRDGTVVADVGTRALASPGGVMPFVEDMPHLVPEALHEEHIVFRCDGGPMPEVGDKLTLDKRPTGHVDQPLGPVRGGAQRGRGSGLGYTGPGLPQLGQCGSRATSTPTPTAPTAIPTRKRWSDWYRRNGYDFLVLTDHNHVTVLEHGHGQQEGPLMIPGEEVSVELERGERPPFTLGAIGIRGYVEPVDAGEVVPTLAGQCRCNPCRREESSR